MSGEVLVDKLIYDPLYLIMNSCQNLNTRKPARLGQTGCKEEQMFDELRLACKKRSRAFAYTYMLSHNYHYATTTAKAERRIVDSPPMLSHNNSYLTQAWVYLYTEDP